MKVKDMRHKKLRLLLIVVAFFALFSTSFPQLQTQQLPVVVTCRKSFFGGSYVLQIQNTSASQLKIWLEAREKIAAFLIPVGRMIEIGWVQGFRFDEGEAFFIGADGYVTLRETMPSTGLSAIRIGFLQDGSLTLNLSQSFIQNQLSKYFKLPMIQNYPRIVELEINEMPQIILRDGSNRIYANVVLQSLTFSGKVRIPINVIVSFVSYYIASTGIIAASQINVDNININELPQQWFTQITNIINQLIPIWFSNVQLFQLDRTTLKYCKFLNVRQISIQNGRLVIELL